MARIAVVVATKNRAHLIKSMLTTLMRQDIDDWECIIINDKSTDQTKTILANITDKRIKVFDNCRDGKGAALNFAKTKVTAPLVKFFDDDDYLLPNSLRTYCEMMEETGAEIGYSARYTLTMNNQLVETYTRPFSLNDFLDAPMLGHGSLVIKTSLYKRIEHDDTLPASIDFDFICKCALTGGKVAWTDEPLYIYKNHMDSITFASNAIQKKFYIDIRAKVREQLKVKPVTNEVIQWSPKKIER